MKLFRQAASFLGQDCCDHTDSLAAFSFLSLLRYDLLNASVQSPAPYSTIALCEEILSCFPRLEFRNSIPNADSPLKFENMKIVEEIGFLAFSIIRKHAFSAGDKQFPSIAILVDISDIYSGSIPESVAELASCVIRSERTAEIAEALDLCSSTIDTVIPSGNFKDTSLLVADAIDVVRSLRKFSSISPPFICHLVDSSVPESLAKCFDISIPFMETQTEHFSEDDLVLLKGEIVSLSKCIIIDGCLNLVTSKDSTSDAVWDRFDVLLPTMVFASDSVELPPEILHAVKPGRLIQVLDLKFQLLQKLSVLKQFDETTCPLDSFRLSYLYDIVASICDDSSSGVVSSANNEAVLSRRLKPEHTDEVEQIRDLFSDYSDDFALACLSEFGFSVEQTVNAILEGRLPSHLTNNTAL